MNYSELLAKTLATENLTVRRADAITASFHLKTRVLTLPNWKDLTDGIETMLIEHEVGHALFTGNEYIEFVKENPNLAHLMNVLEDARIERLFKERYPGSRKDFVTGYKELREKNFFELDRSTVNTLGLTDRINAYFKAGVICGVQFSRDEIKYVDRACKTVTIQDVIQLALDILEFIKNRAATLEEQNKDIASQMEDDLDGEEGEEGAGEDGSSAEEGAPSGKKSSKKKKVSNGYGDGEGDFDDESDDANGLADDDTDNVRKKPIFLTKEDEHRLRNQFINEDLKSTIQASIDQKLENLASNASIEYLTLPDTTKFDHETVVISYKEIIETLESSGVFNAFVDPAKTRQFVSNVKPQVNHLVSQFELRKAARTYALRSIRKTGVLNTEKVSQYKIKDDIFRRKTIVPEGKNHGMIMLLDWSGSMTTGGVIYSALEQVMQMVMFCRQVQVPFRVYAFCDPATSTRHSFQLLEFFNDRMSLTDYNKMVEILNSRAAMRCYGMSGTPLAPAVAYMENIIPKFREQYKLDKVNFITFTDGENTSRVFTSMHNSYYGSSKRIIYVTDQKTKREYTLQNASKDEFRDCTRTMQVLYQVLKDRYDVNVINYFVANDAYEKCVNIMGIKRTGTTFYASMNDFKNKGFSHFTDVKGSDHIYIISRRILNTGEFQIGNSITSEMTAAKIAGTIKKLARTSTKGKVLIENLAESIS